MKTARRGPAKTIDWQEVRARLARISTATEHALRPAPEQARALLEERARNLARVPQETAVAGTRIEVIVFGLANELYALETRHVRGVLRLTEFTPLPQAPAILVGVLNLRGEILAVLDLRSFLGLDGQGLNDRTRVLVLGSERAEFGVLADAAHEVKQLRLDEVLDPPPTVASVGRECIRGVTKDALILLDGAALLRDERLFIDQEARLDLGAAVERKEDKP